MTQTSPAAARQLDAIPVHRKSLSQRLRENWQLYVMLLIPVVLTIVYKYWPMYGIQIAFRDFKASRGITGSEWVGLYWFERFFTAPNCVRMIKNTVLLSLYSLLWSFPIPIILSLCINQLRFAKFKRVVQTVLYAPHFISTMVICGMIKIFLSPSGGLLNLILGTSVDFLSESTAFRTIYVASGIWQEAGCRYQPVRSRQDRRRFHVPAHSAHRHPGTGTHDRAAAHYERRQPDERGL